MAKRHKLGEFRCDECDYVAAFSSVLETHKKKHGSFPCDKCRFTATFKSELTEHIKLQHTTSRLYPCDQCDYSATKAGLQAVLS